MVDSFRRSVSISVSSNKNICIRKMFRLRHKPLGILHGGLFDMLSVLVHQ